MLVYSFLLREMVEVGVYGKDVIGKDPGLY